MKKFIIVSLLSMSLVTPLPPTVGQTQRKEVNRNVVTNDDNFIKEEIQYKFELQRLKIKELQEQAEKTKYISVIIPSHEIKRDSITNEKYVTASFEEDEHWIDIVETYYTNSVKNCGKTDAISASGKLLDRGGYIAAPYDIEFGTIIITKDDKNNYGEYEVQDRGGAIKWIDNHTMKIDIFVPNATQKQLEKLGVKKVKGKLINKNN